MSSFTITIPMTPKAKASVRIGKYGQYNPHAKGMILTRNAAKKLLPPNFQPLTGPLLVIAHYRIPAALRADQCKRRAQHLLPHDKRPDGDNLEKFLNDSLNGILWSDDSKIVWLLRSKTITQAKEGETIIHVIELKSEQPDYQFILNELARTIDIEGKKNVTNT